MTRENRYLVIKLNDAIEALTVEQCETLSEIARSVAAYRLDNGKQLLNAVVVESDWPEYEQVWRMIEARVEGGGDG